MNSVMIFKGEAAWLAKYGEVPVNGPVEPRSTALFSDWDLGGDLEELDRILSNAVVRVDKAREKLADMDSTAEDARELGEPLSESWRGLYWKVRAYAGHYTRQVARIKEAIEKRESERESAEKQNKATARLRLGGKYKGARNDKR